MDRINELLAQLETLSTLTDEELDAWMLDLRTAYEEAREGELTPEVVAALASAADGLDAARGELVRRDEAAAELEAQLAELDTRIDGAPEDVEGEEPEAVEEATEVAEEEPAAEEPETEAAVETEEIVEEKELESIAASASLAAIAKRAPARTRPRVPAQVSRVLSAVGAPNRRMGTEYKGVDQIASDFIDSWESMLGGDGDGSGFGSKVPIARVQHPTSSERTLRDQDPSDVNGGRVSRIMSAHERYVAEWCRAMARGASDIEADGLARKSLTAAGGIVAPSTPIYDQNVLSHASRPVQAALPSMNATRGAINWMTPPTLTDVLLNQSDAAVNLYTVAQDAGNATKQKQFISAGDPMTAQIRAITNILEFGNLQQRTFPELVAAWIKLAEAAQARLAEQTLLTDMFNASTSVFTSQQLGSSKDLLNYANLAAVQFRSRHRMPLDAPLEAFMPHWVVQAVQNDQWMTMDNTKNPDDVGSADVLRWFASRNIRVTLVEDPVGAGQQFGAQTAGALNAWPSRMEWLLFHPGAFLRLDAGTLDLGVVRDSTLNLANKYQIFSETFEAVAYLGIESLAISSSFCVNGATSGTVDPDDICEQSS